MAAVGANAKEKANAEAEAEAEAKMEVGMEVGMEAEEGQLHRRLSSNVVAAPAVV